jgi:hypothetical protein
VAAGLVLAAWAGLFWFLLATGRWSLYLSTRTFWVVPTGAALLTIAAALRLASARTEDRDPLSPRLSWTLGVIALPAVLILALPPATLSSYALGRRAGFVGSGVSVSADDIVRAALLHRRGRRPDLEGGMIALRARAGGAITLEGFVWRETGAADEIS